MQKKPLSILLADNDIDDCNFFKKAVKDLTPSAKLDVVHNGENLMKHLNANLRNLPDILFLELIMPRKNGFECLSEINSDEVMKQIFVVICSDSYSHDPYYHRKLLSRLYKFGANHFIHKSGDYDKLKLEIFQALCKVSDNVLMKEPCKNLQIKIANP
jgi:DNA-binding NarL/FixJ family response regulator